MFYELIAAAGDRGWKIFLLGAAPEVNEQAESTLLESDPNLKIVGRMDGYFDDSAANIEFVAMGSPKQEIWIQHHRSKVNASILMGVGGTFDVVSSHVKWAPKIFRQTGTEWLYRLVSDPRRIRRQLVLPKFVWLVIKYKLGLVND